MGSTLSGRYKKEAVLASIIEDRWNFDLNPLQTRQFGVKNDYENAADTNSSCNSALRTDLKSFSPNG